MLSVKGVSGEFKWYRFPVILFPWIAMHLISGSSPSAAMHRALRWRHQMEIFSTLLALCVGSHQSPVNSPHKGQWRRALMFSLICTWTNGWANNRNAGDLRRHRVHYDVTVMLERHVCTILEMVGQKWAPTCDCDISNRPVANPTMHLSHILQCTFSKQKCVHICAHFCYKMVNYLWDGPIPRYIRQREYTTICQL